VVFTAIAGLDGRALQPASGLSRFSPAGLCSYGIDVTWNRLLFVMIWRQ